MEETDGGRKGMMPWVSRKTAEEVVPCGGQGRGLGEDMRSSQAAACVGGKVMGEDKKSDQLPALKRPARAQGGEQRVGHPPSRGLPGQNAWDTPWHGGPSTVQASRGKPWPPEGLGAKAAGDAPPA